KIILDEHEGALPDDARALLERVRGASRHMERLIDALLTLSRLTRRTLQTQAVDLSHLAQEVAERMGEETDGPPPKVEIEPGLRTEADPYLVEVLMQNLLSNAFKFTKEGQAPHVEVGQGDGPDGPFFYVRDHGVGFPSQHAEKLFNPFQRLHGEGFSGTGIGLATAQRIVSRHGGSIWAEGEVNQGATICFTL
ncbi:MAG: ATP-binding protein, partial [Candidatus Thermoplasmatota archaeon]|nr:ATP-binding protein [Candidatus Thermoplasmatota archaeon]